MPWTTTPTTDTGVLAEFGWGHDDLGNVTAQHETWPGSSARPAGVRITAMTYDDVSRLKTESVTEGSSVTTTTYTYDAGNNRTSKAVTGGTDPGYWTYVYNTANQLTSWKKWTAENGSELRSTTLTYDDNGNRTSQLAGGTFDTGGVSPPNVANSNTSYTWDKSNRLSQVAMADGKSYSYLYDYRMRRISTAAGGAAPAKHTSILFSGGLSVAEYESPTAPSAGIPTGTPVVQYQRGPDMGGGVGGMLYSLRTTSGGSLKTRYSISNGRGDVVAQSDQAAVLTWTASYEAYGRRTVETNAGENEDKQRANSKDEDPTGLLNEGFRYRDLETGVWLSRDPAGFVDGPNVYAYVKQNPWTSFDPDGLAENRLPSRKVGFFEGTPGESRFIFDSKLQPALADKYKNGIEFVNGRPNFQNKDCMPISLSAKGVKLKTEYEINLTGETSSDTAQVRKQMITKVRGELKVSYDEADRIVRDALNGFNLHHHLNTNKIIVVNGDIHKIAHYGERAATAANITGKLKLGGILGLLAKGTGALQWLSPGEALAGPLGTSQMGDATVDGAVESGLNRNDMEVKDRTDFLRFAKHWLGADTNNAHSEVWNSAGYEQELQHRESLQNK